MLLYSFSLSLIFMRIFNNIYASIIKKIEKLNVNCLCSRGCFVVKCKDA